MTSRYERREFLRTTVAVAAGSLFAKQRAGAAEREGFSFILLGDLHFDRLAHHDFGWLERNKPDDLSQIKNYSRLTAEIMPQLLATVRQTVAELDQSPATRVAFVLQVGDLVEGLCGTEDLAVQQNEEALALVRGAKLGVPFLFTKGNHDVTGDGATAAFAHVFHPFLREQATGFVGGDKLAGACYSVAYGDARFYCFDAYDSKSLDWLEAALAGRTEKHCFVVIHPPVVPYGARATWNLYAGAKNRAKRDKLLELLGRQEALVLGGHLHKFSTIARTISGGGRFAQVAVSSVISQPKPEARYVLSGVDAYDGDQLRVEPNYSPGTANERRAVYDAERPFVKAFEYADQPGYAVVSVAPQNVRMTMYSGITREAWKSVDLSRLLFA